MASIRRREHKFSVSSTGRVFNAITGLKREIRSALRFYGQRVGSVDIRCAQPALLAMLLTQNYPPGGPNQRTTYKHTQLAWPATSCLSPSALPVHVLPASLPVCHDVAAFRRCALDGSIYEVLCGLTGESRDFVKLRFLVDVLAKRGQYPSAVEDAFRAEFPSVFRAIRTINRQDHGTLIRLLQRTESWLVIERVAPRLLTENCRIVTLHDTVYSTLE